MSGYDQRKAQVVAGMMACFSMRDYDFEISIGLYPGIVRLYVADVRNGIQVYTQTESVTFTSLPNDKTPYDKGYDAAMKCICRIQHKKGKCVE